MHDNIYMRQAKQPSHSCQMETQKKKLFYLMFPGCHFSPEAFHFSFVLQEYHWHGLITKKLLTQKVMLLWTMVWEEMGKPIYESSYKLLGILSSTNSSSYASLRRSHIRIAHV